MADAYADANTDAGFKGHAGAYAYTHAGRYTSIYSRLYAGTDAGAYVTSNTGAHAYAYAGARSRDYRAHAGTVAIAAIYACVHAGRRTAVGLRLFRNQRWKQTYLPAKWHWHRHLLGRQLGRPNRCTAGPLYCHRRRPRPYLRSKYGRDGGMLGR